MSLLWLNFINKTLIGIMWFKNLSFVYLWKLAQPRYCRWQLKSGHTFVRCNGFWGCWRILDHWEKTRDKHGQIAYTTYIVVGARILPCFRHGKWSRSIAKKIGCSLVSFVSWCRAINYFRACRGFFLSRQRIPILFRNLSLSKSLSLIYVFLV